jgi:CBS-domain-containing membrane protein
MTREVVTVAPATSFKDCVELIRIHGVSALPVVDRNGGVLGIVSEQTCWSQKRSVTPGLAGSREDGREACRASPGRLLR